MLARTLCVLLALAVLLDIPTPEQQFPPGFVDPALLLAAAASEIGEAYLPAERIAFDADLFDTHELHTGPPTPAMTSFWNQVKRMKLGVTTIAPVHGRPVPWSEFEKVMNASAKPYDAAFADRCGTTTLRSRNATSVKNAAASRRPRNP